MERNRGGFRGNNSGTFPPRDRSDFQKPWRANFNQSQSNNRGNPNPWFQNTPQPLMQSLPNWPENQLNQNNRYGNDSWQDGYNNSNAWNQNQNRERSRPQARSQHMQEVPTANYWRQSAGNEPERDSGGPWQGNTNYNRDRRTPYDRPQGGRRGRGGGGRQDYNHREPRREPSPEVAPEPAVPLTPLEAKIERLITAVQSQPDDIGQLILLQNNNEIPPVLLNNAAHQVKNCVMAIERDESNGYSKLRINSTIIAEGMYSSKKDAKEALYEMGLEILKSKCFFISSKSHYEEVSMDDISNQKNQPETESNPMDGSSKALQMMLKMGWGGKGLGTKEQGEQKTVADKIVENISREGLGISGQSAMQEVDKILADYARSNKTITLGFDSGFTKDERAQIHSIAAKYHLKSKSEGGFNSRRITVSKKFSKWILIRELLSVGLENQSYILTIPDEFQHLWTQDEEEDVKS